MMFYHSYFIVYFYPVLGISVSATVYCWTDRSSISELCTNLDGVGEGSPVLRFDLSLLYALTLLCRRYYVRLYAEHNNLLHKQYENVKHDSCRTEYNN